MPKLKTKKAVAKRIKFTKGNKKLRSRAGHRHLLSGKSSTLKNHLKKKAVVSSAEYDLIKRSMPYGG